MLDLTSLAVTMKNTIFCVVMPCNMLEIHLCFGGTLVNF
jgi:hypothetical protein